MYDIPTLLALRLLASAVRVQQQTLETMALDEPGTHQARELLHQVDALLEEMIDPEQLQTLVDEQHRLSRKVG
ncbi:MULTISPECIES: hypothetical protein [Pseudomonas]|uniref:Uncharacterized protein n=1 Tax=Pseudomonas oryzihabitans TaxID=47885 RepID=A0A2Z5AGC4_9PSED|nr:MULTISPECIES: hypothetical protein [Pseudomonas]AXA68886.1 hypothetical protein CE139_24820 [Pseudomonas oryzihabitans]KTT64084.1 hypothetical protein NS383_16600 [Pseudomonas psychrotolerans]QOU99582.1 hypothetical protein [Pseudomonas syringae pv. actinidiae]SEP48127.1 hypothetical protein SAMN02787149_1353 [Pseudomonas sp. Snoq117.2]